MTSQTEHKVTHLIDQKKLIENTAFAMGELGNIVSRFEAALTEKSQNGQLTEDVVLCAQDLDLISQIITELRGLLNRIASQTPENFQVSLDDVLHPVRLERLRQTLLSGPSAPQEQPCQQPDAIHLFD